MIPVAKPYITKEDLKAVSDTVATGWVLQGPKVEAFEKLLADYIKTPYAITTSSCTTALHIALIIFGIKPGDEVLVPSFSFIASTNCIMYVGATPVFVDIDPKTYNMDPRDATRKVTKKTKAIIPVHQIGLPADMQQVMKIAKAHKLFVLEDAACALGSFINGKHVGTIGDIGAFSFHPRKNITTGEGGLVTTKKASWAQTARALRSHGASMSVAARHTSKKVLTEAYTMIGYNYRMSDIHAALGITQFAKLTRMLELRTKLAARYDKAFAGNSKIAVPFVPKGYVHSYQSYMVRLDVTRKTRDHIMQKLLDEGIATRRGIMTAHTEKPYRKLYPKLKLPQTEKAADQTVILPLYPQMSMSDQDLVIDRLQKILRTIS